MMNLFNLPERPQRRRPAATGPIDAAPLLSAPDSVSRYRIEAAIMECYLLPLHQSTPRKVAALLEVPEDHRAVKATINAIHDAALVVRYRGTIPFAEVEALARTVQAVVLCP